MTFETQNAVSPFDVIARALRPRRRIRARTTPKVTGPTRQSLGFFWADMHPGARVHKSKRRKAELIEAAEPKKEQ